jgi:hypothetical protein
MNLEEAKNLLRTAVKHELRDHAFGDCEVTWFVGENEVVASGYFGSGTPSVSIQVPGNSLTFHGDFALELRNCFASEQTSRNDSTGPDDFVVGRTMPGLTLEGVRKELTGE